MGGEGVGLTMERGGGGGGGGASEQVGGLEGRLC